LIETEEGLFMTNVGKVIDDLRKESPDFDSATAEIELVRGVGDTLQQMREQAGLTQEALATRLGISASRVSQLESGTLRDAPSLKMLARFAYECGQKIELGYGAALPGRAEVAGLFGVITKGFAQISQQIAQATLKSGMPTQSIVGRQFAGAHRVGLNERTINALTANVARAAYVALIDAGMNVASADDIQIDVRGAGNENEITAIEAKHDLQMTVTVPFGS
jgi:transcriptional regulator with XRE-family HTH domain